MLKLMVHTVKFRLQILRNCLTLEDGMDRLSRNVGNKLPIYAAQNPRTAQIQSENLFTAFPQITEGISPGSPY